MGNKVFHIILFLLLVMYDFLPAQMPDWSFFRDGDGNVYYFDKNGKIWTSGKPEFQYKTITVSGMDYYIRQTEELFKSHYPVEGLILIKTILAMPRSDQRIIDSQSRASSLLNTMKRLEGSRFDAYNEKASPLLYRQGEVTSVVNDIMFYSIGVPGQVTILNNRWRKSVSYRYNGILFGVRTITGKEAAGGEKFDMLIAVDAEEFAVPIKKIEDMEESLHNKTGFESIIRQTIERNDHRIISSYESTGPQKYFGFEGIYVNNKLGYIIRTIAPVGERRDLPELLKKPVFELQISRI
ncbi:MAG: hypothetical protein CVV44_18270 [Spirochaetae bacterium HGW-Spirochaetae-1]|jgi:hypothetical protein|nr:MAG: hypothetical protein CVV44_18270 [Spirochaetae bacterium HGW-Spirochaetae-1]